MVDPKDDFPTWLFLAREAFKERQEIDTIYEQLRTLMTSIAETGFARLKSILLN
jgi:hypothetical protein